MVCYGVSQSDQAVGLVHFLENGGGDAHLAAFFRHRYSPARGVQFAFTNENVNEALFG